MPGSPFPPPSDPEAQRRALRRIRVELALTVLTVALIAIFLAVVVLASRSS